MALTDRWSTSVDLPWKLGPILRKPFPGHWISLAINATHLGQFACTRYWFRCSSNPNRPAHSCTKLCYRHPRHLTLRRFVAQWMSSTFVGLFHRTEPCYHLPGWQIHSLSPAIARFSLPKLVHYCHFCATPNFHQSAGSGRLYGSWNEAILQAIISDPDLGYLYKNHIYGKRHVEQELSVKRNSASIVLVAH